MCVPRQLRSSGSALALMAKRAVRGLPFFSFSFFGLAIPVFSPPCLSATLSFAFSVRFDLTLTSSLPPSVNADCDVVSSATFGFPDLPCLEAVAGPATARVSARASGDAAGDGTADRGGVDQGFSSIVEYPSPREGQVILFLRLTLRQ